MLSVHSVIVIVAVFASVYDVVYFVISIECDRFVVSSAIRRQFLRSSTITLLLPKIFTRISVYAIHYSSITLYVLLLLHVSSVPNPRQHASPSTGTSLLTLSLPLPLVLAETPFTTP